jgi:hypothetical protein
MRAEVYQKLHEFNLHIDQGVATLRGMAQIKKVSAREIEHMAEYFEELRSSCSGWLTSLVSDQEDAESARLFGRRRRQEMAEDPMHGGWLEEEREKKRLEKLSKAKRAGKKSARKKKSKGKRRARRQN